MAIFPEELRRKIAALEEVSWAEEQRLRLEQKETQARSWGDHLTGWWIGT